MDSNLSQLTNSISHYEVVAYLESNGWKFQKVYMEVANLYKRKDLQLIIPIDPTLTD